MRETRQKIKRLAKVAMAGNYFRILLVLGLEYLTFALLVRVFGLLGSILSPDTEVELFGLTVNYVSVGASVLSAILAAPFEIGIAEYILSLVRKKEAKLGDVFSWYGDFGKLLRSVPYGIWCAITSVFQVALFDFPLSFIQAQLDKVLVDLQEQYEAGTELFVPHYGLMDGKGILIAVGAMAAAAVLGALFVPVLYIYADTGKIFFAVFSSPVLMIRHLWSYLMFVLSFTGFYIGTVFTLGLLGLYLIPYFGVSNVVFTEYVRAKAKFDGRNEAWV